MTPADFIIKHEGNRLDLYQCPAGKWTIGAGRNLEDNGISLDESFYLLNNDIARVEKELDSLKFASYLNYNRRLAMIDMLYNLGFSSFLKFRKMIAALENQDYQTAAVEMLDSKWAKQVPGRAQELAYIVKYGVLPQ